MTTPPSGLNWRPADGGDEWLPFGAQNVPMRPARPLASNAQFLVAKQLMSTSVHLHVLSGPGGLGHGGMGWLRADNWDTGLEELSERDDFGGMDAQAHAQYVIRHAIYEEQNQNLRS